MLKLIMSVKRLPCLSQEEFDHHWQHVHGPLVRKHARLLGIRRYVQTSPLANRAAQDAIQKGRGTLAVDFDGCAELWWDDLESHYAARSTPEGLAALKELVEDEKCFIDLGQSQLWYGTERDVI